MVAPIVLTSTIQLMAVRPKNGIGNDSSMMNRMAFRGTPPWPSWLNHDGNSSSFAME